MNAVGGSFTLRIRIAFGNGCDQTSYVCFICKVGRVWAQGVFLDLAGAAGCGIVALA